MRFISLIGNKYGRATVLIRVDNIGKDVAYLCKCECEKTFITRGACLTKDKTKSCGCLRSEIAQTKNKTHGHCTRISGTTSTYKSWASMLDRCKNPNNSSWDYYGKIGVSVCERWNKFENFLADMGKKPEKNFSLDRIDPYGNYEPNNCRWATVKQQLENRRPIAPCVCPNCGTIFTPLTKRTALLRKAAIKAKEATEKDEGDED